MFGVCHSNAFSSVLSDFGFAQFVLFFIMVWLSISSLPTSHMAPSLFKHVLVSCILTWYHHLASCSTYVPAAFFGPLSLLLLSFVSAYCIVHLGSCMSGLNISTYTTNKCNGYEEQIGALSSSAWQCVFDIASTTRASIATSRLPTFSSPTRQVTTV